MRRGREMIDLLAVEEPKPKPAKIRAVSYEAGIEQLWLPVSWARSPGAATPPAAPMPRVIVHPAASDRISASGEGPYSFTSKSASKEPSTASR